MQVNNDDIVFCAVIVWFVDKSTAPPEIAALEILLLTKVKLPVKDVVLPEKDILVVLTFKLFMSVVFVEILVVLVAILVIFVDTLFDKSVNCAVVICCFYDLLLEL